MVFTKMVKIGTHSMDNIWSLIKKKNQRRKGKRRSVFVSKFEWNPSENLKAPILIAFGARYKVEDVDA